jgi:hypothetical protein
MLAGHPDCVTLCSLLFRPESLFSWSHVCRLSCLFAELLSGQLAYMLASNDAK